jgi:hypothetical protein
MQTQSLLREFFEMCDGGLCQDFLTENEKRLVKEGITILTGCMQKSDTENGNGRIYSERILRREVDRYQSLIKENRALGELDHPDSSIINLKIRHFFKRSWINKTKRRKNNRRRRLPVNLL